MAYTQLDAAVARRVRSRVDDTLSEKVLLHVSMSDEIADTQSSLKITRSGPTFFSSW